MYTEITAHHRKTHRSRAYKRTYAAGKMRVRDAGAAIEDVTNYVTDTVIEYVTDVVSRQRLVCYRMCYSVRYERPTERYLTHGRLHVLHSGNPARRGGADIYGPG